MDSSSGCAGCRRRVLRLQCQAPHPKKALIEKQNGKHHKALIPNTSVDHGLSHQLLLKGSDSLNLSFFHWYCNNGSTLFNKRAGEGWCESLPFLGPRHVCTVFGFRWGRAIGRGGSSSNKSLDTATGRIPLNKNRRRPQIAGEVSRRFIVSGINGCQRS